MNAVDFSIMNVKVTLFDNLNKYDEYENDIPSDPSCYILGDSSRKVYPMVVSTDEFGYATDWITKLVNDDTYFKLGHNVSIPVDDDPFRYWENQLVYIIDYSREHRINYVFEVVSNDIEFDDYEIYDHEVIIVPYLNKEGINYAIDTYGKDLVDSILNLWNHRDR